MKYSEIRLALTPDQCGKFNPDHEQITMDSFENVGITASQAAIESFKANQDLFVGDAGPGTISTPNVGTPVYYLRTFYGNQTRYVLRKRVAEELMGVTTAGNWEDFELVFPFSEDIGQPWEYGDTTLTPYASYNLEWVKRGVVRFEMGFQVRILEQLRQGRANIDVYTQKRRAAITALDVLLNRISFSGYRNNSGVGTYGLLNDPFLPAYVAVAEGASTDTTWSSKTGKEIADDIVEALQSLNTQSGFNFNMFTDPCTLAISADCAAYLTKPYDYTLKTVRDWLRENYPNVRVVQVPEFMNANNNENVFYLYADEIDGQRVIENFIPSRLRFLGIDRWTKGFEEAYSCATAGVLVRVPIGVVRRFGI